MKRFHLLFVPLILLALPLQADSSALKIQSGAKIAFLGDSITAQGWESPGGYVHLVVSGLATDNITVTPIPAGISGHTSKDMLARLDRDVLSKSPDWMTLSCGVNDVWHGVNGVPLDQYKTNITSIVDQAQAKGIKVVILTSTCIGEEENDNNKKLVAYNDFLRQLAKDKNCLLADESALYAEALKASPPPPNTRLLTVDGVHPNPKGHMVMARGILQALGVPESDFAKIETAWDALPAGGRVHAEMNISPKCDVTLGDYQTLEKIAAAKNTNVDGLNKVYLLDATRQVIDAQAKDTVPDVDKIRNDIQQRYVDELHAALKAATAPAAN